MLIKKSERTHWYLGLQRRFDFAKTSFAPVSRRLRMARSGGLSTELFAGDATHGSARSFRVTPSYLSKMPSPPAAKVLNTGSSENRFSTGSQGRSHLHDLFDSARADRVSEGFRTGLIQRQRLQLQTASSTAPLETITGTEPRLGGFPASLGTALYKSAATRSRSSHPLSLSGLRGVEQGFAPAATLSGNEYTGSFDNLMSVADESQRPSQQRRMIDNSVEFPNEQANTEGFSVGGAKTAVSTLHLDGSSLGRWTLQHLERSLGRPTSGMTGIDPRATLPRSRVSPF